MSQWDAFGHEPLSNKSDPFLGELIQFFHKKVPTATHTEVRASALPICARRYSFDSVLPPDERPSTPLDFVTDLIFGIGHTTHRLVQHWMGLSGKILVGDWKCKGCSALVKWKAGAPKCTDRKCPDYDLPMEYQEIGLTHPSLEMSGHPDGVLRNQDGEYAGFEIKTTRQARIDAQDAPVEKHLDYQVACYAAMLKASRGIDLKEFYFFYFSRDIPPKHSFKVGYSADHGKRLKVVYQRGKKGKYFLKIFRRDIDLRIVKKEFQYIKKFLVEQKRVGKKLLPLAKWGICENPQSEHAQYCPYRYMCFSKETR